MAPGTSPSITGLTDGKWEVAWNAGASGLWVTGRDVDGSLDLGERAGTSPSITSQ
jgi:hypothetical protein